jgi:threonine dehydrogenase-like Zn-dependent dehydrogenase
MKAIAVFAKNKTVQLIDHPVPDITKPTQVKIRMLQIGVCGTDRDICAFQYGTPPKDSDYLIIGHESLGEVVEVGKDVTRFSTGDLVVLMVRRPCRHEECFACRNGRQDFCFTGDFTERGIKELHGFMSEFVVDEERYINRVPRALKDIAILTEPLTIAEKALTQVWQLQQRLPWGPHPAGQKLGYNHKAVVLGAGPVGLLGAMVLLQAGFQTFVYSRGQSSSPVAQLVNSLGAKFISSETSNPESLSQQVGNIDLVYEATGAAQVSFEVMEVIGINSVMVFTGIPGLKGPINVDADLIMRNMVLKNQIVLGTVNADRSAFENAVRDLESFDQQWPEAIRSLITGQYPPEAFQEVLLGPKNGIKNVITF